MLEGINYIGLGAGGFAVPDTISPLPAEDLTAELIAGYRQLIARAHANDLKIIGGTRTPFAGMFAGRFTTRNGRTTFVSR